MTLIDLGQLSWQLAAAGRLPVDAPLDDPAHLTGWIPATVPGVVQRDLMAAGQLPDLYRALDLETTLAAVNASDWWYRTTLPALNTGSRAWLRFEGIDYQAAVAINGVELGRGAGMFAARQWEVTEHVAAGPTTLAVRVWGGGALPHYPPTRRRRWLRRLGSRLQSGIPAFDDRLLTLKAPVHFGWDFAPRVLPAGIWDEVTLHTAAGVGLLDIWPRADWGTERGLVIRLEIDADREREVELVAELAPSNPEGGDSQHLHRCLHLKAGLQVVHLRWPQARCRPWSTHDRGFPHLYRLAVRISVGSDLLDETSVQFGARTVGWQSGGVLALNGAPLRLRGANWTSLDLLAGDPGGLQRCRSLLEAAVAAGVNAIRVWGGGGRERRFFYNLCDELGLLVWQELPVACVFIDRLPEDDAFLRLVRSEAAGIIRFLRRHPSVALWCGGNEWGPGRHPRLAKALSTVAAAEDPGRRWLPASPGPGDSHNWRVWHGKAAPGSLADDPAPLLSEFGLAAPPDSETLAHLLPETGLWPPGSAWENRQAQPDKLWHYARAAAPDRRDPQTLDEFITASQTSQARGLQAGIEAYRLRADGVGVFIWQWNEPWPAICWSILPYTGPPKAAYHQVARSFAPLAPLACVFSDCIELWVVNDRDISPGICTLTATAGDRLVWRGEVVPPANDRLLAVTLPRPPGLRFLALHLTGPGLDADNDYDLLAFHGLTAAPSPLRWLRERLRAWLLRW